MNRRAFLTLVAAGMSAELADRLLWVPKAMITVPAMPTQGLMFHKDAYRFVAEAIDVTDVYRIDERGGITYLRTQTASGEVVGRSTRYPLMSGRVVLLEGLPQVDPVTWQATGRTVPRLIRVVST